MTVQLNRKLSLEHQVRTPDLAGGFTEEWAALGQLWASVKPGSGRDAEFEGLSTTSSPYKITVRAAPYGAASRPKAGQRFRDGARYYLLIAVTDDSARPAYLTCFAREEEVTS